MNVTQLVFCWPREAKYSCEPDSYEGWAIEHYSLEIGTTPLQHGDIRHWEEKDWKVAQIEDYSARSETHSRFTVVLLTLNGEVPQRDPWDEGDSPLMSIYISGEEFVFAWPERSEFLPQLGSAAPQLEGWEVSNIQEFEGLHLDDTYDRVLVCWCAPIKVSKSEMVAASA